MSEYIEQLRYEADISDVKRKLGELEARTADVAGVHERGASRSTRAWSGVTRALGTVGRATAVAAVSVGALATGAGAWGLKIAAANEQAQISFSTMLGSAERAGAFLENLRSFAAKTPFEFPELQTAASSLISVGIEAEKVIPIMTTLGNVTSGMGTGSEGVKRATIALQQMAAAGKITGEDLNQLRDAGIPVFDLLAAATGRSKAEVAKLAQAGKLGAKDLAQMMRALESGKGLERFTGLMEQQSESLTGMLSTLKDTLGQGLAEAMVPMVKMAKDVLPTLVEPLGDLLATFSKAAGSVMPLFAGVLRALMPVIQPIAAVLAAVADKLGAALLPVLTALAPHLELFVQQLGEALVSLTPLIPPLGKLLVALAPLLPAVAKLANAVLDVLIPPLTTVIGWVAKLADWLTQLLGPAIDWISEQIRKWGKVLLIPVAPILAIAANLDTLRDIAGDVWNALISGAGEMVGALISGFRAMANVFLSVVGAIVHGAATAFGWVPGIGGKLKAADKHFRAFKESFLLELQEAADSAREWGSNAVISFVEGMNAEQRRVAIAAGKITAQMAANMRVASPAKEGPLSLGGGPEGWGARFGALFADGMIRALGTVRDAATRLAGAVSPTNAPVELARFVPPVLAVSLAGIGGDLVAPAALGANVEPGVTTAHSVHQQNSFRIEINVNGVDKSSRQLTDEIARDLGRRVARLLEVNE